MADGPRSGIFRLFLVCDAWGLQELAHQKLLAINLFGGRGKCLYLPTMPAKVNEPKNDKWMIWIGLFCVLWAKLCYVNAEQSNSGLFCILGIFIQCGSFNNLWMFESRSNSFLFKWKREKHSTKLRVETALLVLFRTNLIIYYILIWLFLALFLAPNQLHITSMLNEYVRLMCSLHDNICMFSGCFPAAEVLKLSDAPDVHK